MSDSPAPRRNRPAILQFFVGAIEANKWWVNPATWAAVAFLATCVFIAFASSSRDNPIIVVTLLTMLGFTGLGIVLNLCYLPIDSRFLGRLILLYVSLIFLFANVYFALVIGDDDGKIPFAGIHHIWTWLGGTQGREIRPGAAFESYVDCFHFSCVTMSTVGYGDMYPTRWYSKLLVDLQLMMTFAVVVVGLGRYFSRKQ